MNPKRVAESWKAGLLTIAGLKEYYRIGVITKEQYKEIKALPQAGRGA